MVSSLRWIVLTVALSFVLGADAAIRAPAVESSVAAFLGLEGTAEGSPRETAQLVAIERITRRCMEGQGLSYVEHLPERGTKPPGYELDPVSYAAKFGFGVTTLVGWQAPTGSSMGSDPNRAHLDQLSPDAARRYRAALFGESQQAVGPYGGGCVGLANAAVYGVAEREMQVLAVELEAMWTHVQTDSRSAAAETEWLSCVAATGLLVNARDALMMAVAAHFEPRLRVALAKSPGGPLQHPELLSRLQDEERRVASEVAACEEARSVVMMDIAAGYEAEFIRDHRDVLEAIRRRIVFVEAGLGVTEY